MTRYLNIFLLEFKHFRKSKTKVISYLVFILACVFSLFNGFELQKKQLNTIDNIQINEDESISEIITWYENGEKDQKTDLGLMLQTHIGLLGILQHT